ncbi:phosphoribosylglycinamide formyltransferase [Salinibius halmophilus]|uniref:phosphoribosylglycinamide formyltransferase n=1 Tax=Salinibius halmophilus TaxID=1853216 RepID=UPI000E66B129|nr:phosphoribosylglycinamide formyltransferase [Salinibius halmophilus]
MSQRCRVVVLISGSGSNLQAILDHPNTDYEVVGVLSNKADAFGLIRAQKAGIATAVISHKDFTDRLSFDQAMIERIDAWQPDLVVLAGFMRILTEQFVDHYLGKLINIHPSLLPKYPGLDTHARAIAAGETEHGATVHFVTPELDAGPSIMQAVVPIAADDDTDTLQAKVHRGEHKIYPLAVQWIAQGRVVMQDSQTTLLDNLPISREQLRQNYD